MLFTRTRRRRRAEGRRVIPGVAEPQKTESEGHHASQIKGTIPSCQDTKRVAYRMDAFIMVKEEINTWVLTIYIGKLEIPVEKSNVLRHSVGSFRKSEL